MRHLTVLRDALHLDPLAVPVRPARVQELKAAGFRASCTLDRDTRGACIVASSTDRHIADATEALTRGFAVLVEKPLSHSTSGLSGLKATADAAGLPIFVACNLRFDEGLRTFRDRLPDIGNVNSVRIECQSFLPDWRPGTDYRQGYAARKDTGGVLLDLIHEIDYAIWCFGRPERVFASLGHSGQLEIDAEDSADLLWTSPAGAAVSIRLDYLTRQTRRRMIALGDAGGLEWDAVGKTVRIQRADGREEVERFEQERNDLYRKQAEAFLNAVSGGSAGDLATFDEGATAVAVCDAARRSSRSREEEDVRDWRTR